MTENNKMILQSYELSTAIYDFNVYEKRIMYRIIELIQSNIHDVYNTGNFIPFDDEIIKVEMPLKSFLKNRTDKNYQRIKDAFLSLQSKIITYEDNKKWKAFNVISNTTINKETNNVSFYIHMQLYECCCAFARGYSQYKLNEAFQLSTPYSMRLFELISNQKQPVTYTIDDIKRMWCADIKYVKNKEFIRWVIKPIQEEIAKKTSFAFDFELMKNNRRYEYIKFTPIENVERLEKELSIVFLLNQNVISYLKSTFGFTTKEIKNNLKLFQTMENMLGWEKFVVRLSKIKEHTRLKKRPKAYVIACLKNQIQDAEEK
jgi:plasmid replication initiation protein